MGAGKEGSNKTSGQNIDGSRPVSTGNILPLIPALERLRLSFIQILYFLYGFFTPRALPRESNQ